ncbi:unnamed protein product [Rodentolepis nana]|uniref:t-SNARE coiled-coil homology domain-containing protein n=1 Tax=Rodentolepis nana TaxID=102285 RepID=A0A0R3TQR3_RODNA|nr:unnamed protein product [Rodentolepis nana]
MKQVDFHSYTNLRDISFCIYVFTSFIVSSLRLADEVKLCSTLCSGGGGSGDSPRPAGSGSNQMSNSGRGGSFTENLKWRSEHPGTDAPGLLAEQEALLQEQDEHLDQLGTSISRLKNMSHRIGMELGDQVALLDDFGEEMAQTESRLDHAMRRAAHLLHIDSSRAQWFVIGILLLTLLIIIILFAIL